MSEHRPIAPPGWYILCLSSKVKRKPMRMLFSGFALVVFRDAKGQIGALEDKCAHRGVPLSQGIVLGDSVQCPYHGWEYDREGTVTNIPALQHCSGAQQIKCVRSFVTVEQEGFIWIKIGSDSAVATPPLFANFGAIGWSTFTMQTRFTGTVESCLENFLDCPHATFVHRYWFRSPTKKFVKAIVRTLTDGAEAEFFEEPREKSVVWWLLAPRRGAMQHTDRFIAPNTSKVDYKFPGGLHYIITSSCTPAVF
jgi:phenylpropionate dioxygenase-like ring-hydroxylating dioxygenase large terminal subunit